VIDAACVLADLSYTLLSTGCASLDGDEAPAWLEVLADVSIAITTLFLVEIPLTVWALGVRTYNPFGPVPHASLHAFDAAIILTTFVLEVVLRGRERELAGLLIVLRMWRLIKLVGGASLRPTARLNDVVTKRRTGVAVGAGEIEEETLHELENTKLELELTQRALRDARAENAELHARLASLSTSYTDG